MLIYHMPVPAGQPPVERILLRDTAYAPDRRVGGVAQQDALDGRLVGGYWHVKYQHDSSEA